MACSKLPNKMLKGTQCCSSMGYQRFYFKFSQDVKDDRPTSLETYKIFAVKSIEQMCIQWHNTYASSMVGASAKTLSPLEIAHIFFDTRPLL